MNNNVLTTLAAGQRRQFGDKRDAYRYRDSQTGKWLGQSWADFDTDISHAACALETLGISPEDMIAVFSANCPQILITDIACFRNRAVPVSIYSTSSPEQVCYIVNDSGARMLFVGDIKQYRIARSIAEQCPRLERIVLFDDSIEPDTDDRTTMRFADLLALGASASDLCRAEVAARTDAASPDDIATLIYTSGTTGEPKGAILPHSCFNACFKIHTELLTMLSTDDTSLSFLPMSHIFEKAWTYFCLYSGIIVHVNSNPKEITQALREVHPSCMCAVPRFWEKAYATIQDKLAGAKGMQKALIKHALKVGAERNLRYARLGKKAPLLLEMQYRFFDKRIFAAIRGAMGVDRGNLFPTAGAPLSANIVEFFHTIGVNIVIGYGLSETTATVSCFPDTGFVIGTVGTAIPDVNVRIGEDNEIQIKAPTVMRGYYNRPDETAKAFTADGWLRTGDAGYIDDSGAIVLTERIKDLFKTSNGKYIAPQAIESRLGEDRFIEQVAVIGDRRKYVTAIIIPAFEALKDYALRHKIDFKSIDDLINNAEIRQFFASRIERLQKGLAGFEQIKRFTLLAREFTIENGELTNTLKLRRAIINRRYASLIEAMYC